MSKSLWLTEPLSEFWLIISTVQNNVSKKKKMELCLKQMFCLNLQGNYSHSQDEMGGGDSETNKAKQGSWTSQLTEMDIPSVQQFDFVDHKY